MSGSVWFEHVAPTLWAQGWRGLIPLRVTEKRPAVKRWTDLCHETQLEAGGSLSMQRLQRYSQGAHFNTGLCAGNGILMVDVDCDDEHACKVILSGLDSLLGRTPAIRTGRPPRFMAFYRCNSNWWGPTLKYPHGLPIELILPKQHAETSGQAAVAGIHPKTNQPYSWPRQHILRLSPEDLPMVTKRGFEEALDVISEHAAVPRSEALKNAGSHQSGHGAAQLAILERDEPPGEAAIAILQETPPGARNATYALMASGLMCCAVDLVTSSSMRFDDARMWLEAEVERLSKAYLAINPDDREATEHVPPRMVRYLYRQCGVVRGMPAGDDE